jgi:hypothetical protein
MKRGLIILATMAVAWAQTFTLKDAWDTYLRDLHQRPDDFELRRLIIRQAPLMKPPPIAPAEADQHFIKGIYLQKEARDQDALNLALNEYRQTLLLAPWLGPPYYNQALALASSNRYDEAIQSLQLYLLTRPNKKAYLEAQDRILTYEARREIVRAQQEKEAAARKEEEERRQRQHAREVPVEVVSFATINQDSVEKKSFNGDDTFVGVNLTLRNNDIWESHSHELQVIYKSSESNATFEPLGGKFFVAANENISNDYYPKKIDPRGFNGYKINLNAPATWDITVKLDGRVVAGTSVAVAPPPMPAISGVWVDQDSKATIRTNGSWALQNMVLFLPVDSEGSWVCKDRRKKLFEMTIPGSPIFECQLNDAETEMTMRWAGKASVYHRQDASK